MEEQELEEQGREESSAAATKTGASESGGVGSTSSNALAVSVNCLYIQLTL